MKSCTVDRPTRELRLDLRCLYVGGSGQRKKIFLCPLPPLYASENGGKVRRGKIRRKMSSVGWPSGNFGLGHPKFQPDTFVPSSRFANRASFDANRAMCPVCPVLEWPLPQSTNHCGDRLTNLCFATCKFSSTVFITSTHFKHNVLVLMAHSGFRVGRFEVQELWPERMVLGKCIMYTKNSDQRGWFGGSVSCPPPPPPPLCIDVSLSAQWFPDISLIGKLLPSWEYNNKIPKYQIPNVYKTSSILPPPPFLSS